MENIVRFTKNDRSTFKYWFAHWSAYQMTALNLGCWKWKFLLHDIEKPFIKLFKPYKFVQKFHREHANHHLNSFLIGNKKLKQMDFVGMVVDWECARFTKKAQPRNAAQEYEVVFDELEKFIMTYTNTNNNEIASYIKENNLNLYETAEKIQIAYEMINSVLNELNIPHYYNSNYLNLYLEKSKN